MKPALRGRDLQEVVWLLNKTAVGSTLGLKQQAEP